MKAALLSNCSKKRGLANGFLLAGVLFCVSDFHFATARKEKVFSVVFLETFSQQMVCLASPNAAKQAAFLFAYSWLVAGPAAAI